MNGKDMTIDEILEEVLKDQDYYEESHGGMTLSGGEPLYQWEEVYELLNEMPGVKVLDAPAENVYPMPKYAEGQDDVFVGRIRRDFSQPNTLNLWVVADNLRKGAATNAVQIMQFIIHNLNI